MKNKDYIKNILVVLFLLIVPYLGESVQAQDNDFYNKLSDAALSLTKKKVIYDPAYRKIPYPNGDVPSDRGVCTDVVIRSYRKLGIDLQKEVLEGMKANFSKYPNKKNVGFKLYRYQYRSSQSTQPGSFFY